MSLTVILKIIQERTTGICEAPIWWDLVSRIILVEKKRNFNFQQNHTLLSINGAMSPLYNKLGLHKLHTTTKNGLQFTGICFNGTFSTPRMVNSLVHSSWCNKLCILYTFSHTLQKTFSPVKSSPFSVALLIFSYNALVTSWWFEVLTEACRDFTYIGVNKSLIITVSKKKEKKNQDTDKFTFSLKQFTKIIFMFSNNVAYTL